MVRKEIASQMLRLRLYNYNFSSFVLIFCRIYWTIFDGAECNRQLIKLHFKGSNPAENNFITHNVYTGEPFVFMVDCKVRNIIWISKAQSHSLVTMLTCCVFFSCYVSFRQHVNTTTLPYELVDKKWSKYGEIRVGLKH